jgi:uncharacterized protein (DUF2336 family)
MQLLELVGTYFANARRPENPGEYQIAIDIARRLLFDADADARRRVAEILARQPGAPLELVDVLAHDEPAIARPLLSASPVLGDPELLEVATRRSIDHRLAIATRSQLSETLCRALLGTDEDAVACTLLDNPGARISRQCLERCVERSRDAAALQPALARRQGLDADLIARLLVFLPDALRRDMRSPEAVAMDIASRNDAKQGGRDDETRDHEAHVAKTRIAAAMAARRIGDPSSLVTLLRAGNRLVFEAAFAELTSLPPEVARRVLHESGNRPLAVACKAAGVQRSHFVGMLSLLRQGGSEGGTIAPAELEDAARFFDAIDRISAEQTLARWRHRTVPTRGRSVNGRRIASYA